MSDHDPFNEPETAHPRARELMKEVFFWDCVNELAPFGSDEGHTAYYEWRDWRIRNPRKSVIDCLNWALSDELEKYDFNLIKDEKIKADIKNPETALLSNHYDMFTLDTTIIGTCLGQLMDEGLIELQAKPFLDIAITRQLHPLVCLYDERREILTTTQKVANSAYLDPTKITTKNVLEDIVSKNTSKAKKRTFLDTLKFWWSP